MTIVHAGKARWARAKAEDLHRQAWELEQDRSGGWQAMARRRRGTARLRREADRFDLMAARWGDPILTPAA
jgi:aminoglycoside phosphotransferase